MKLGQIVSYNFSFVAMLHLQHGTVDKDVDDTDASFLVCGNIMSV
jgi:hypothetical protein